MSADILNLKDLIDSQYGIVRARDCLARAVRLKLASGEALFSDIFGLESEKRRFVEILAAGKGVLLTGEYGVAKTDMAKHVLGLLNDYFVSEPVYAVERCPVQEDPAILLHYMTAAEKNTEIDPEPCPICKKLISDAGGDPSRIAVRRLERLVEGTGFARVQGGGDVMPEEVIGTYNLLKLSQIGDPFDPRVFEPGKIGQASRGVLFIDEIGKLPETAQHALIQASQEGIVMPSKSRETFPVDFLLVATTNPVDEEYICGAVRDRLVSLKIPLVGPEDEMQIVRKEIERVDPPIYLPEIFLRLTVEVVRAMRSDERLEMGPRTSIHAGLIGRGAALLEGRGTVSFCNIKEGIYTSILGKALFEDKADVEEKLDGVFPEIAPFIARELPDVEISEIVRSYVDRWGAAQGWEPQKIKQMIEGSENVEALSVLSGLLYAREKIHKFRIYEVMADYLEAFDQEGA